MEQIRINLSQIENEESFHDLVVSAFSFPSYYGRNKDAFWDCLTEIFGEVTVSVSGYNELDETLRGFVDGYITMLKEYQEESGGEFKVDVS